LENKVRVFISSTFRDMHAERDHLITVVFPELRERLVLLGLDFFDIDLRWGIPKIGIDGERANPWKYCKKWIDRVQPFFICIIGERYGSKPPEEEILEPEDQVFEGQSVTELEIRHAVLTGRLRRRSFFYFRDTKVPSNAPAEMSSRFVDADLQENLNRLKKEIEESKRPVRRYRCKWTGAGFEHLEEFGKMVLEDLWSGVLRDERYVSRETWKAVVGKDDAQLAVYNDDGHPVPEEVWRELVKKAAPQPVDPLDEERQKMTAFASSRLLWFQGREAEIAELMNFIEQPKADNESKVCVVTGEGGSGKSALLAKVSENFAQSDSIMITHFVGATERSADVSWVLERWNRELDRAGIPLPADDAGSDLRKRLSRRLSEYDGPRKIILLIDGVNQLLDGLDLFWPPLNLGSGVRVILSTVEAPPDPFHSSAGQVMAALVRRLPKVRRIEIGPLKQSEIRKIVVEFLEEYCKELDFDDIDTICRMEQTKNPLYLLVLLNELRTLGGDNIHLSMPAFLSHLKGERLNTVRLFEWVLDRLEVFGKEAVSLWCTYLRLGRAGMGSKELCELLHDKFGEEGARNALRIERGIRKYLLHRGKLIDFYHDQLRQAVELRYVKDQNIEVCHQEIGKYFLKNYGKDEHALSEVAYHLFKANLDAELYQVVDDAAFRRKKIALRHSVHDLCSDILHAFDTALQTQDLPQIAHFGFLHAAYAEGHFEKPDILELHRENPRVARHEIDLFLDRPRFRLLLLLALKELQAGQISLAEEYIQEALQIRSIKIAESDRPFLIGLTSTLLENGCRAASGILERIMPVELAVKEAAQIAISIPPDERLILLESAVFWLKKNVNAFGNGKDFVEAYESLLQSVIPLKDEKTRDSLLLQFQQIVDVLKPTAEKATETKDVILLALITALGVSSDAPGTGIGVREAAQSLLASAWFQCGHKARALQLMQRAIDDSGKRGVEPFAFKTITNALLHCDSTETLSMFRNLLGRSGNSVSNLRAILEALSKKSVHSSYLDLLDTAARAIMGLPMKQRSGLLLPLAQSYAATDKLEAVRRYASKLTAVQLFLFTHNPALMPEDRFTVLNQQMQLDALTRSNDRSLKRLWLKRSLRWLQEIEDEKKRLEKWKTHIGLCLELQNFGSIQRAFAIVDRFRNEQWQADALARMLDAAEELNDQERSGIRNEVLRRCEGLSATFRSKTRIQFLQTIRSPEIEIARNWDTKQAKDPALRAEVLAQLAGVYLKHGMKDDAESAWLNVALADQETLSGSSLFAARAAASARSDNQNAWKELLQKVDCPDLDVAGEIVHSASNACGSTKQLAELEKKVKGIRKQWFIERPVHSMRFSLARAWTRLQKIKRATAIASNRVPPEKLNADTLRYLVQHRSGLITLLKAIMAGGGGTMEDLLECIASVPGPWKRQAFRELFIRIIRMTEDFAVWRKVESAALLARCLATYGQPELARGILQVVAGFKPSSREWETLQPHGRAAATLQVARAKRALGEIDETETILTRTLIDAAAIKATNFRSNACSIMVDAWRELRNMNSISADSTQRNLESHIRDTIREIPKGFGDKYKSLSFYAIAWARFGEMQKALSITETIESEEQREETLVQLIKFSSSWPETIQLWERIFDASARKRAATIIAEKHFYLPSSVPSSFPEEWPRETFRYSARWNQTYPILAVSVIVPLLTYAIFYLIFPFLYIWIALVALSVLISAKSIRKELRKLVRKRWRVPAFLLALPLIPVWWGIQLALQTVDRWVPRLRLWKFLFWQRPENPHGTTTIDWITPSNVSEYLHFLRFALHESATFDLLLAPLLFTNNNQSEISSLLQVLPAWKIPQEIPASQRKTMADLEESIRSRRWYNILRSAWKRAQRTLGISITKAVAFPITAIQARLMEKRFKKAHELHLKANELIQQYRHKEALPILKQVVAWNPDEPSGWSSYAVALSRNNQLDEAVKAYHAAIEKGTGTADEFVYWYNMGFDLFNAGRNHEAMKAFQRVVEIAPHHDELYENARRGIGYCKTNLGLR
jgi:tetratricopeptide (TPR) repeat protein